MKKHLRLSLLSLLALLCGNAFAATETITFSELGLENGVELTTIEGDNVTLTFDVGTGSTTPKYYTSNTTARLYAGNTLTVTSDYDITEIVFTFNGNYTADAEGDMSVSDGTYDYSTLTWTGSTKEVMFTNSSSTQLRITEMQITVNESGKSDANLAFSEEEIDVELGADFTSPTFTYDTDATITFTSDNEEVATVDATGVISLAGATGTAVITASCEETETYAADETTCTINVYSYKTYAKATTLEEGKEYLLVAQRDGSTYYAYPKDADYNYGYLYVGTISSEVDTISVKTTYEDGFTFTSAGDDAWYMKDVSTDRYYYQSGTYNSFQISSDAPSATYSIAANDDGTFTMVCNGYTVCWGYGSYTTFAMYEELDDNAVLPYLYALVEDEGETWSLSGDINSWSDESGSGYEFTYEGDGVYTLELETLSGTFKLRKDYAWDDQYGTNGSTINVGETYTLTAGGDNLSITDSPELIGVTLTFTIGESAATLLIEADSVAAIDYSQYAWSLCGEINSWDETDTTYDFTDNGDKTFTLTMTSIDQTAFKLVADHSWDVNFGSDGSTAVTLDTPYTLVLGSQNNLWMDATYENVTLTLDCSVTTPTLTVTQSTTGINNVTADTENGSYEVYTLSGMHVMSTADSEDVNALPKGVYIVNNKKVVVR